MTSKQQGTGHEKSIRHEGAIWHGGDVGQAKALFPDAPQPWLDLSTGINPIPYPLPPISPEAFRRLPSPCDRRDLERAAAAAYGTDDPAWVVAAPGTQAPIEVLPRLRPPGRVAVVAPTYAEHAHAWERAGHAVAEVPGLDPPPDADVAVVVNPNNPDGRRWPGSVLRPLAATMAARGGWLVVDEAFADLEPAVDSLARDLPDATVVLRSFGKAYGLAGVRLGFAIARPPVADCLRQALGPWAVSGPAITIGRAALADPGWLSEAILARAADAARLDRLLESAAAGKVVGGTCLFRLLEREDAPALFAHLGQRGIWVRRFQQNPSRLRFGLPGSDAEWHRLAAALRAVPSAPNHVGLGAPQP